MNRIILISALSVLLPVGLVSAAAPASASTTTITSKQLEYDYKRLVAEFKGDVVVIDPQIIIESDNLTVVLSTTNEVRSVTAVGSVRIKQGEKNATCNKAIYIARESKLILIGNVKLMREQDTVTGDEVTYWLNDNRMICKPGKLLMISGGRNEKNGKDLLSGFDKKERGEAQKQRRADVETGGNGNNDGQE